MHVFDTKRLNIRFLRLGDLPAFHEMQSNPKVMQYTGTAPMSEAENQQDLEAVMAAYAQPENHFWVWAMIQKSDQQMVGTCAIVDNEVGEHEIGYRLLERYWGNGYGLEITEGLIDHGLGQMQLPALVAYVDVLNIPSVKILDRSRFQFVKQYWNEAEGCEDRMYRVE